MIVQQAVRQIEEGSPFPLTSGQKTMVEAFASMLYGQSDPILLIDGHAGTGKTTMVAQLVGFLNDSGHPFVLMAPTGRAAKVLSQYTGFPATTIHRRIYLRSVAANGSLSFSMAPNRSKNTVFFVDEASMIGTRGGDGWDQDLLQDLINYVGSGKGCKLVFIGDSAQLPPVGMNSSPALVPDEVDMRSGLQSRLIHLDQVMRQAQESSILSNANRIRQGAPLEGLVDLSLGSDLDYVGPRDMPDAYDTAISRYGQDEVIILTRSNRAANQYNRHVRHAVLGFDGILEAGDKVMVVRNNYHWLADTKAEFLANGEMCEVLKTSNQAERYGARFLELTCRLVDWPEHFEFDAKALEDTLNVDAPNMNWNEMREFFRKVEQDYMHIGNRRTRYKKIMEDPWFNALQIKYAYAVTCHKAQGGQWETVFIDTGFWPDEADQTEYRRWLYTAMTRAKTQVHLVNIRRDQLAGLDD